MFLLKVVQHLARINWYRVVFGKDWMTPSPMESIRHLKAWMNLSFCFLLKERETIALVIENWAGIHVEASPQLTSVHGVRRHYRCY